MKRFFLFIILFFSFMEVLPSQIDKGYGALRIYDYFKAKEIFYKQLKKHPIEASFGLAIIFYRNDNPFHQLDSASKYIYHALENWKNLPAEKKTGLKAAFQISDSALISLYDSISAKAYFKLMSGLNIQSAEKYLSVYFRSPYNKKVICLRDSFAFLQLKARLSSALCQNYMYTYPQSCYLNEAKNLYEFALYSEITESKTDKSFLNYIGKYPKGKYVQLSKEELLNYYIGNKDAGGIYSFIKNFGSAYSTNYAWSMLLSLEVPNHVKSELETFLQKFPDYPLKSEIEEEFKFWHTQFLLIKKNDKFGYCDSAGKILLEPAYSEAEDFSEGYALVQKNDLYGYINKAGQLKIDFQFTDAGSFVNHTAAVQKNKVYYLIDYNNKILSKQYDEIGDFSEGFAIMKKDNLYGAINQNGDEIIKPAFEMLSDFSEQRAAFLKNGKYGFIDRQGFTTIVPAYDWAAAFKNGFCRVRTNRYYGLINKKGDFVIEPAFDQLEESAVGIYLAVKNNLYGFIDSSGCYLSEVKYLYNPALKASELSDGKYMRLFSAKKQDLQNRNGNKYFSDQNYEEVSLPVNDMVIVKDKNKFSLYNLKRSAFIKKAQIGIYSDGKYWYVTTKKGIIVSDINLVKTLFTLEADKITSLSPGYFLIETEDGKGMTDQNGVELLAAEYDEIKTTSLPHLFYLERNEKGAYYSVSARTFIWKEDGF